MLRARRLACGVFLGACLLFGQSGKAGLDGASPQVQSLRRVALVIGNAAYGPQSLKNPPNDARMVATCLRGLQFEVKEVINGGLEAMAQAVDAFVANLGPGTVGLFYYSGHGLEDKGINYLVSTDFKGGAASSAKYKSLSANEVQERMEERGSNLNILILDACRNNPADSGARALEGGLARMESQAPGTVIVFATASKKTASDNPNEENGLFTKYLLEGLDRPGLDLRGLFDWVGMKVYTASGHEQMPFIYSSPLMPFHFRDADYRAPGQPHDATESLRTATPDLPVATGPQIEALTADYLEVAKGGVVRLHASTVTKQGRSLRYQWSTSAGIVESEGDSAILRADNLGGRGLSGPISVMVSVVDEKGHSSSRSLEIRLKEPVLEFTADRVTIKPGESVKLHWRAPGASRVRISPDFDHLTPEGEKAVSPRRTQDYTLTAEGPDRTLSQQLTVLVAPDIVAFEAVPASVPRCAQAMLRWSVEGSSTTSIEPDIGAVAPLHGYVFVQPAKSTVYVLKTSGPGGEARKELPVSVIDSDRSSCGAR